MAFSSVMETPALPESLRSSAAASAAAPHPPPPPPGGGDRHLTAQLDLNTSLLERLHAAETRKLQDHAATVGREALLAETRELLNSLNDENAELREELARASEQLRTMGRELGSSRSDREESETTLKQLNYNLLYQLQEKNALLEAAQNTAAEKERRAAEAQSAVEAVSSQLYEAAKERDALQREHDTVCCTMRAVEEQCGEALAKYARLLPEGGRERVLTREGSVDQRLEAVMGGLAEKVLALEEAASREAQRGVQGETQAATLRSRLHAMDAACLDLRKQLESKTREAAEATAEMQRQLDSAREAGHSLALDVVRCRQDFIGSLEEGERRAEVVRAEYRGMLAELVQVEAACDRGALQLAAQQSELAALRAAEAEGARTTLQTLRQAAGQAQTQAEQRQGLREEVEQLRKKLRAERQRRDEGDDSLAQVRQHRDQAKQEAALLHAALKQLKEENGGLEAAVRRLQREHQGADSRGEQLQRQAVGLAEELEEERRAHGRVKETCRAHETRLEEVEDENRKLSVWMSFVVVATPHTSQPAFFSPFSGGDAQRCWCVGQDAGTAEEGGGGEQRAVGAAGSSAGGKHSAASLFIYCSFPSKNKYSRTLPRRYHHTGEHPSAEVSGRPTEARDGKVLPRPQQQSVQQPCAARLCLGGLAPLGGALVRRLLRRCGRRLHGTRPADGSSHDARAPFAPVAGAVVDAVPQRVAAVRTRCVAAVSLARGGAGPDGCASAAADAAAPAQPPGGPGLAAVRRRRAAATAVARRCPRPRASAERVAGACGGADACGARHGSRAGAEDDAAALQRNTGGDGGVRVGCCRDCADGDGDGDGWRRRGRAACVSPAAAGTEGARRVHCCSAGVGGQVFRDVEGPAR